MNLSFSSTTTTTIDAVFGHPLETLQQSKTARSGRTYKATHALCFLGEVEARPSVRSSIFPSVRMRKG